MSVLTSPIPSYQLPETKYCPGCKQDINLELFGVDNKFGSGISSRCRECNAKATRESYYRNFDRIAARKHEAWVAAHPKEHTGTFILLKTLHFDIKRLKRCPYCNAVLRVCHKQKDGICTNEECKQTYLVSHVLSQEFGGFKLKKIYEEPKTDIKPIVIFIKNNPKTYRAQITAKLGIERNKIQRIIKIMKQDGLIITRFGGRFLFISLSEAGLKLFNSYQVEA